MACTVAGVLCFVFPEGTESVSCEAGELYGIAVVASTAAAKIMLAYYAYLKEVPRGYSFKTGEFPTHPEHDLPDR